MEELEARVLARQKACGILWDALATASRSAHQETCSATDTLHSELDDSEVLSLAQFLVSLGKSAEGLLERWDDDVLTTLPDAGRCTDLLGNFKDLKELSELMGAAQLTLQATEEKKIAALEMLANAAAKQQAVDEFEMEDDLDDDEVSVQPTIVEGEPTDTNTKKKKKGWAVGKWMKGRKGSSSNEKADKEKPKAGKDKSKGEKENGKDKSKGEKENAKDKSKVEKEKSATPPTTPRSSPGQQLVEMANEQLLDAVEEMEEASVQVDTITQKYEATSRELMMEFEAQEVAHARGVREAIREAALVLDEWAVDARREVLRSKGPEGEISDNGESSSLESPLPSNYGLDCESSWSTAVSEAVSEAGGAEDNVASIEEQQGFEWRAQRCARKNDELLKTLPLRRGVRAQRDFGPVRPTWEKDPGAGGSSPSTSSPLTQLVKENVELEEKLRLRVPSLLRAELRKSSAQLEREVGCLNVVADRCVQMSSQFNDARAKAAEAIAVAAAETAAAAAAAAAEEAAAKAAAKEAVRQELDRLETAKRVAQQRAADKLAAEQKLSEQRALEELTSKEKAATEERRKSEILDQQGAEELAAEHKLVEQRKRQEAVAREQAVAEERKELDKLDVDQRAAEVRLTNKKAAEQKLRDMRQTQERSDESRQSRSISMLSLNSSVSDRSRSLFAPSPISPFQQQPLTADASSPSFGSDSRNRLGEQYSGSPAGSGYGNPFLLDQDGGLQDVESDFHVVSREISISDCDVGGVMPVTPSPNDQEETASVRTVSARNPFSDSEMSEEEKSNSGCTPKSEHCVRNGSEPNTTFLPEGLDLDQEENSSSGCTPKSEHCVRINAEPNTVFFAREEGMFANSSEVASMDSNVTAHFKDRRSTTEGSSYVGDRTSPDEEVYSSSRPRLSVDELMNAMCGSVTVDELRHGLSPKNEASNRFSMSPASESELREVATLLKIRRPRPVGGLSGCVLGHIRHEREMSEELPMAATSSEANNVFAIDSLEVALAKSDLGLHNGRLDKNNGTYWNWKWEEFASEEMHFALQRSSHRVADVLNEDDWNLFAYEILLSAHHWLDRKDPAAVHVEAVLPICRVSLGINVSLHHHLAELTLPDTFMDYSPFDVRFRAALVMRCWTRFENPCFRSFGSGGVTAGWTKAWIGRQLAVITGSVKMRAHECFQASNKDKAKELCARSLQKLRSLDELALHGLWGASPSEASQVDGRQLLLSLMNDLDILRPPSGQWSFHTIFVARVFGQLWRAAADEESEDKLSLDAPTVAAALLSGLHPHLGPTPLQLETHGILLAQQLWTAACTGKGYGSSPEAGLCLPAAAMTTARDVLKDFFQWLQRQDLPINTAAVFARSRSSGSIPCHEEAAELTARRLLTAEMRDGLVQTLTNYRRHLEPDAFRPALELWRCSCKSVSRSEFLVQSTPELEDTSVGQEGWNVDFEPRFRGRMGHWFIFKTLTEAADLALKPFDDPQPVDAGDWRRLGPRIKKHVDGLAVAVETLLEEIECERSFYNSAWEDQGIGGDHLGITAQALCSAVRPRVKTLITSGLWPTSGQLEIPAGGGKLLRSMEMLDRLASRWSDPRNRPSEPLVDIVLPHVCGALKEGFNTLDRDITSHALEGDTALIFQPLRPPTMLYCDGVVTLWRFVNDALDAPLSLGIPVDIVVQPFLEYLTVVLQRVQGRLIRPCERNAPFRIVAKIKQVVAELGKNEYEIDSDADGEDDPSRRKKKAKYFSWKSSRRSKDETLNKNAIIDAELLEIEPRVSAPPIHEVNVRICSLGFCLTELDGIYNKLVKAVNSGDDENVPTVRHSSARRSIFEEMPDMLDLMREHCGHALAKYLAQRLVYFELRQDLFERLYFAAGSTAEPSTPKATPSTPKANADTTPVDANQTAAPILGLDAIIARRRSSLVALVSQTPLALLVPFVTELSMQLIYAWVFIILDYLRRSKLDQGAMLLDDDFEALQSLISDLMQEVRRHVAVNTGTPCAASGPAQRSLAGTSTSDCDDAERRLADAMKVAQELILKVQSSTPDEMARYANKVCCDPAAVAMGRGDPAAVAMGHGGGEDTRAVSRSLSPRCTTPKAADEPRLSSKGGVKIAGIRFGGTRGRARSVSPRGATPSPENSDFENGVGVRRTSSGPRTEKPAEVIVDGDETPRVQERASETLETGIKSSKSGKKGVTGKITKFFSTRTTGSARSTPKSTTGSKSAKVMLPR